MERRGRYDEAPSGVAGEYAYSARRLPKRRRAEWEYAYSTGRLSGVMPGAMPGSDAGAMLARLPFQLD
jgi:hypothetical protein